MARLEQIRYTASGVAVESGALQRKKVGEECVLGRLPQVVWQNGAPWREANLWAYQRNMDRTVDVKTIFSQIGSLVYYANWLEAVGAKWWDFPVRKDQRCLIRFRGELIKNRTDGKLSPSTATKRMRDVIAFYRWLDASKLLVPEWPMWTEKQTAIVIQNQYGFSRTMKIPTTDLAIKNRTRPGERLEDGLLPVSASDRDVILRFAQQHASQELYLLLTLGFYSGMRIGSLSDLKIGTLTNAIPDPAAPGLYRLTIGPGAAPQVSTKYNVTGQVWITSAHLKTLTEYFYSARRLLREAKAAYIHKELIFLTRFGNPYHKANGAQSSAINVEMHALRKKALYRNVPALFDFHFHQSRCTFATELAKLLMPMAGPINAIAIIKDALLHSNESTTLKYIKFIEKTPAKIAFANEFTTSFLGIHKNLKGPNDDA